MRRKMTKYGNFIRDETLRQLKEGAWTSAALLTQMCVRILGNTCNYYDF